MNESNFILNKMALTDFPTLAELPKRSEADGYDGANGSNRETTRPCQIRATNDYEAIQCWLNEYRHNQTTYRLYQKEAERCLLWSIYQQGNAFSSLDTEDFKTYFDFLSCPEPKSHWCGSQGGRGRKRGSKDWRPFVGPLSPSSKATAITVIHSLVSYLIDAQYLAHNPIKLIRKKNIRKVDLSIQKFNVQQRILALDEWNAILNALENLPEDNRHQLDEKERLRFLVHILYFLGLRVTELVNHTWKSFRKEQDKWWFYVMGKGGKLGKIPVNDALMNSVCRYRKHLHFVEIPTYDDDFPLIASWRTGQPVTARFINKLLKCIAYAAAQQFENQPEKAQKLKKFSAHWLRHLSASMQDKAGIKFKHIRSNLRHSNDDTTRLYVHALDQERHEDMEKLSL